MQGLFHEGTTIVETLKSGVFLEHDVVFEVVGAKIKEIDPRLSQVAHVQDPFDGLELASQDGVVVPPLVVRLTFLLCRFFAASLP